MTSKPETSDTTKTAPFDPASEIRLVPAWGWMLAVLAFLGTQLIFHGLAWPHEAHPPGAVFRVLFPAFIGLLPAFFGVLIGYVNRDAGRRGMSRALWTTIVILVPNGIGFIIYFILRQPILVACPRCGHTTTARANYCPHCAHSLRPTCPQCKAALRESDRFCPNCGYRTHRRSVRDRK